VCLTAKATCCVDAVAAAKSQHRASSIPQQHRFAAGQRRDRRDERLVLLAGTSTGSVGQGGGTHSAELSKCTTCGGVVKKCATAAANCSPLAEEAKSSVWSEAGFHPTRSR
jgi:hypothetical protein